MCLKLCGGKPGVIHIRANGFHSSPPVMSLAELAPYGSDKMGNAFSHVARDVITGYSCNPAHDKN